MAWLCDLALWTGSVTQLYGLSLSLRSGAWLYDLAPRAGSLAWQYSVYLGEGVSQRETSDDRDRFKSPRLRKLITGWPWPRGSYSGHILIGGAYYHGIWLSVCINDTLQPRVLSVPLTPLRQWP